MDTPTIENKTVSYSKFSLYENCQKAFELSRIKKIDSPPAMPLVFGTAMHNTVQDWLKVIYDETAKKADSMNLHKLFSKYFRKEYLERGLKSTNVEIIENLNYGYKILDYIQKKRNKYFSKRDYELIGVELKLRKQIRNNLDFIGYLDVVIKDKITGKIIIYDLKTSLYTWKENKKKDFLTRAQLILYKKFYSGVYNVLTKDIKVVFMILKKKLYENSDYPQSRVQKVEPPSSDRTIKQYLERFNKFIDEVFNEDGTYNTDREYPTAKYAINCRYCHFKSSGDCPKWNKRV